MMKNAILFLWLGASLALAQVSVQKTAASGSAGSLSNGGFHLPSGATITIDSGATIANNGTATGFGGGLTLTTTGTSGAATLTGSTLNIPVYSGTTYSAGTGLTLTGSTFSVNPLGSAGLRYNSGSGADSTATSANVASALTGGTGTLNLSGYTLSLASGQIPNNGANTTGSAGSLLNGPTFTGSTGTFALANGKTAVISNSLTFTGTDGSTLNIGAGGTLGTNAYTSTAYVPQTTTVNGHALSSNVVVSASDLTTGTLPHAQLPALVSGDIPNNTANTTGSAGSFTGSLVGDVTGTQGATVVGKINGTVIPSASSTALGNTPNAASGFVASNSSGYAAPNVGVTKSVFLYPGFSGIFESGNERAYMIYSGDGLNWSQIHGLEYYTPSVVNSGSVTGSGASPDVFTTGAVHNLRVGQYVTISGMSAYQVNGTFVVATTPTTTTFTCTSLNGSGGAETGGSFSCQSGMRDGHLIKIGTKYFIAYTISNYALNGNGFGVVSSPDLVNWTHVTDYEPTTGASSPSWFVDPANGNTYIIAYNYLYQNTSTTGGFADGVTWSTGTAIAFSDGTTPANQDSAFFKQGATYVYVYAKSSAINTFRIGTSSSISSGFTDQGAPSNWPTSVEGVRVFLDNTGTYWAYFSNGTYSKSTTPQVPSSWSAYQTLNTVAGAGGNPLAYVDNGGGFCYSDLDTISDINKAVDQAPAQISPTPPGGILSSNFPYPLNLNNAFTPTLGLGSITVSSQTVTGIGTQFVSQVQVGSIITGSHSLASALVVAVGSNTSLTISTPVTGTFATGGESYTITPPVFSSSTYSASTSPVFVITGQTNTGGYGEFIGNQALRLYSGSSTNITWRFGYDGSGGLLLNNAPYSTNPFGIAATAPTGALELNPLSTGPALLGGTGSTTPTAGNVGYNGTTTVASGSAVSLTTATSTNGISKAVAAGHYLVSYIANVTYTGATAVGTSPLQAGISSSSATLPATTGVVSDNVTLTTGTETTSVCVPAQYVVLSSAGTIYGVVNATFTVGSAAAYGTLTIVQMP